MSDPHVCRSVSLIVLALLSPLVQGLMASSSPRAEVSKPNIIFLLVDDLGYGDIGGYGVTDIRTPQLDRLAQDGVKLTDCYANGPVCSATRAAFITGRYQQRAGFERAIPPWERDPGLPVSETSIAKLLKENGYASVQSRAGYLRTAGLALSTPRDVCRLTRPHERLGKRDG